MFCINRIKIRVLKDKHDVPEEDVKRCFYRSKFNFWHKYKDLVEDWMLFYNGISRYVLAVKKKKEGINILDEDLYKMFIRNIR